MDSDSVKFSNDVFNYFYAELKRIRQLKDTGTITDNDYKNLLKGLVSDFAGYSFMDSSTVAQIEKECKELSGKDFHLLNFAEWKEKELHILLQQALNENAELEKPKPEAIVEKMVNGRLAKQLKEVCLLQQVYVKDGEMTVAQYVAKTAKEIGKEIKVKAFVRYEVGEGIEKKQSNLAEEVAALTGGAK